MQLVFSEVVDACFVPSQFLICRHVSMRVDCGFSHDL